MNKKAMYAISYGLFVVTARRGEKDNGCITNTVIQVTSDPNATFDLFKRFGFQSGREVDKFDGFRAARRAENGTMIVTEGTNAWISGRVEQMIDLGSHMLFIAEVTDMDVISSVPSATYTYYQEQIKPKPEAVGKTPDGKTVWRCRICGYEYTGEELPEDFICPICKHPASDFEKVTL